MLHLSPCFIKENWWWWWRRRRRDDDDLWSRDQGFDLQSDTAV